MSPANTNHIKTPTHSSWTLYLSLLATQTIGVVITYWNGIPHYRAVAADPAGHVARPETLVWALSAIALIQIPYWTRRRVAPALPKFVPNVSFGHILLFVAHLVFSVAMIFFAFAFIERPPGFHMPIFRYAVTIAALFPCSATCSNYSA